MVSGDEGFCRRMPCKGSKHEAECERTFKPRLAEEGEGWQSMPHRPNSAIPKMAHNTEDSTRSGRGDVRPASIQRLLRCRALKFFFLIGVRIIVQNLHLLAIGI
jgi:hypothetical protein